VWEAAGASEVAVQRLLIQGAKWQKGALGRDCQISPSRHSHSTHFAPSFLELHDFL
jgi:hypothetical protein